MRQLGFLCLFNIRNSPYTDLHFPPSVVEWRCMPSAGNQLVHVVDQWVAMGAGGDIASQDSIQTRSTCPQFDFVY